MFGNKNNTLYGLISSLLIGQIILPQASDWLFLSQGPGLGENNNVMTLLLISGNQITAGTPHWSLQRDTSNAGK